MNPYAIYVCLLILRIVVIDLSFVAICSIVSAVKYAEECLPTPCPPATEWLGMTVVVIWLILPAVTAASALLILFRDFVSPSGARLNWLHFAKAVRALPWGQLRRPITLWKMLEQSRNKNVRA
ncbi:hypothetical protein [Parvibaculum sp. MBR-TMA-1.3b-4.2]|jgi:hypothetical protein